jgi:hypothetical protein
LPLCRMLFIFLNPMIVTPSPVFVRLFY